MLMPESEARKLDSFWEEICDLPRESQMQMIEKVVSPEDLRRFVSKDSPLGLIELVAERAGREVIDGLTLYEKGRCYLALKDYQNAEKFLMEALGAGPKEVRCYLGFVFEGKKDLQMAERQYLLAIKEGDGWGYVYLSRLLISQQRDDEAVRFLRQAINSGEPMSLEVHELVSAYDALSAISSGD
jgi:tetratricopeptide (TPR) repeat protein